MAGAATLVGKVRPCSGPVRRVGILMSTDTDLKPALEFVSDLTRAREAAGRGGGMEGENLHNPRLSIEGRQLWCHWLSKDSYAAVKDPMSYSHGF